MLCKGLPLVAAFGFVIISTPDAKADLCFRYQNTSSGLLVARGAKLPAENTCEPLAMFEDGGFLGAATGTICVSATGFTVIFQYTYDGCVADYFESEYLPPPNTEWHPSHSVQHLPRDVSRRNLFP